MNANGTCPLNDKDITELCSLPDNGSQSQVVNKTFQVVQIKRCESKSHKETYLATLRDLKIKHTGFIFSKEASEPEIKENDIVNINSITVRKVQGNKIFVIKSYTILSKYEGINFNLPDAILYKENMVKSSEEKSSDEPESNGGEHLNYTPLKQLTTFSRDFCICVRVTQKTDMKSFSNSSTQNGKLFSFTIMDKDGTEMQVTCFNKVAEKFFEEIEKDSIYEIRGGYIKINDKKFSTIKSDYKLVLDERAIIRKIEDDGAIKKESANFITIADIPSLQLYSVVDICGLVLEASEKIVKHTKNGEQLMKKLVIGDTSRYKIELSLWRSHADTEVQKGNIIFAHHVKIGDFNGRNISSTDATTLEIDPSNNEEAEKLKDFMYDFDGEFSPLERIADNTGNKSTDENIPQYFLKEIINDEFKEDNNKLLLVKGTVTQITHNEKNFYLGCSNTNCKKKLTKKEGEDVYVCSGCGVESENPTYYYTMNLRVKDASSEYWIDLFGKTAERLIKMPAEEYKDILIERNYLKLKEISEGIEFKDFIFYLRPKVQMYGGNVKKRLYASKVEPVDKNYYYRMLKNLQKILNVHEHY